MAILITLSTSHYFSKFKIKMDRVPTTAEIDAQYKQHIPKFPEKLDWGDTEDYVAIGMRRKPVMVRICSTWFFKFKMTLMLYYVCTVLVLCLYCACTMFVL